MSDHPINEPLIPVLDLMIGQIVLACGGQRDAYRPVESRLTLSSTPLDVAQAIHCQTGCRTFYLADIDSFAGAEPRWDIYQSLLNAGFGLWIDADWWRTDGQCHAHERLGGTQRVKCIVSSETIGCWDDLGRIEAMAAEGIKTIFSIDQLGGCTIARNKDLQQIPLSEWVYAATQMGVQQINVLDLERVGCQQGFVENDEICSVIREIRDEFPNLQIASGGGVRELTDVIRLIQAGCNSVYCATAIHQCLFTPDDIDQIKAQYTA